MNDQRELRFSVAVAADSTRIAHLVQLAYARWVPVIGREPRPMLADYDEHLTRHRFDLIEEAAILVGLIESEARADHFWIENVAVHPDHQGRGLGRRLLAKAEELARAAGLAEMRLLTNAAFTANIDLYQRLGYRITHSEPFGTGTTVYMAKSLNGANPDAT